MKFFATFSESGIPTGLYNDCMYLVGDEVDLFNNKTKVPSDSVEISFDQFQFILNNQGNCFYDGDVIAVNKYIPEELTIEQKRALMPVKTPREFRDILIDEGVLTDAVPDEVTLAIQQIPFDKERTKALNAWQNMTEARRDDPYINMIGAMFGYTPEQIDGLWTN